MKIKNTLLITLTFLSLSTFSQEEDQTLFGDDNFSLRAFVGLNTKGIELNNQLGILSGAEIDLVINHKLNIGFFGYGMWNDVYNTDVIEGERYYYELGYGGMKFEPVVLTHKLVHLTVPVNFGAGAVSLNQFRPWDYNYYANDWESTLFDYDAFVFIEPGIGVELNLLKHMRLNASAGYLFTDRINLSGNLLQPLDGFTGNLSLRFGWF